MRSHTKIVLIVIGGVIILVLGLGLHRAFTEAKFAPATTSPAPGTASMKSGGQAQIIRSVDFSDFTFPWPKDFGKSKEKLRLNKGKFASASGPASGPSSFGAELANVGYGDVTGDGQEEALVVLEFQTGGSSIPHETYVFTPSGRSVRLLWQLSTGDRADGGLRRVYAEQGELIVERYSSDESKGLCCPRKYSRVRYHWNGKQFAQRGETEVLENPEGSSALMH